MADYCSFNFYLGDRTFGNHTWQGATILVPRYLKMAWAMGQLQLLLPEIARRTSKMETPRGTLKYKGPLKTNNFIYFHLYPAYLFQYEF